jgi:hypothetical protein
LPLSEFSISTSPRFEIPGFAREEVRRLKNILFGGLKCKGKGIEADLLKSSGINHALMSSMAP